MVLERTSGEVRHHVFRDLPSLLRRGDLLVANRSRVFPARLLGRRAQGGAAEILLLKECAPGEWEALLRPGRRLREGDRVEIGEGFSAVILKGAPSFEGRRRVRLEAQSVEDAIERFGHTPLPPYVERPDRPQDRERYQTVYARERGSVAAPTAGLHFTLSLREVLREAGIEWAEIVLHVGPGTFKPVKVEDVRDHRIEPEPYTIPEETAAAVARARARGGRVVAVGTTTVRTLESAADDACVVKPGQGETDLVILPGYRFRVIDVLLTNFHLPRSSLLLLASAFAGRERLLAAYAEAIRSGYRFYSYGDAMLVL
jgi:S-adenosylmethionine:tRNA ribosyltransferase-isomerase